MADIDNPLLKALPPETDYLSYLTILEYNLTLEQLPTLHRILQDTTLTANIGWDLVHLLLPLLPASQQCLHDVAHLGNPREVVLKATELLEGLGGEEEADDQEETEDIEEAGELKGPGASANEAHEDRAEDGKNVASDVTTSGASSQPPSRAVQFIALLDMLSILHPRIKTKHPSRFLTTSLQAVLPAYSQVAKSTEATEAVLGFIKALSGTKRPKLPPRKSSAMIPMQATPLSAPDPEGQDEPLGVDEEGLQSRLLQSFLSYVAEAYMNSTALDEDVPGLAWSSRYQEKLHPEKIIPQRRTYGSLFAEEEHLHERDTITGHILVSPAKIQEIIADNGSHLLEISSLARKNCSQPSQRQMNWTWKKSRSSHLQHLTFPCQRQARYISWQQWQPHPRCSMLHHLYPL